MALLMTRVSHHQTFKVNIVRQDPQIQNMKETRIDAIAVEISIAVISNPVN